MTTVMGSCPACKNAIVYIAWINGKLMVIVRCQTCDDEVRFDLAEMTKELGIVTDSGIVLCEEPKMKM